MAIPTETRLHEPETDDTRIGHRPQIGAETTKTGCGMTKILIVGVSGMLGSSAYRLFASSKGISVTGTARSVRYLSGLPCHDNATIVGGIDATDTGAVVKILAQEKA